MHLATLFTLPLLAAAVPTAPHLVQGQQGQVILSAASAAGSGSSGIKIDLDLDDLRLVQFGEREPPVWITELEKIEAKAKGRRFMDITETPTLGLTSFLTPASAKYTYPKPGKYVKEVKELFKSLSVEHMKTFLKKFSGFKTRYYRSDTGRESELFLLGTLKEIARDYPEVTIKEFEHPWAQNSIIARFPHTGPKDAPVVIVGSHQDSTNMWPFLPAPGADDDGSGTTSSLEAFRALVGANFSHPYPVEFHYYSAEEAGLLGSQAIAKSYEEKGVKVRAMVQMDMTAWVKEGTTESVGVIQDFVDPALTEFNWGLVEAYLDIPPVKTQCGYACSDHASFSKAGYQASFSIESRFEDSNKNIHSTSDTIDHPEFSFTHMREFSKLAIAFAYELSIDKSDK
ncbi:hypothetical protein Q8F55_000486 [Vanrija albida]|uniref:Peptide hydrolase n=1 Tax=Vanrija albida TaxID=181172 RepID=A0ABR3QDE5_9TREE